jgi:hypothetical protein
MLSSEKKFIKTKSDLISEEPELTFLAVERRSVVDHFGMDFDLKMKTFKFLKFLFMLS